MTTKLRDRATHGYPFGFSKLSEAAADEQRRQRDNNRGDEIDRLREIIAEQKREIERLTAQVQQLHSRQPASAPRKVSGGKSRGRQSAAPVVMQKGVTYFSYAHVASLARINISNVSRQVSSHGIKTEQIGGVKYIPMAQASTIKNRRAR